MRKTVNVFRAQDFRTTEEQVACERDHEKREKDSIKKGWRSGCVELEPRQKSVSMVEQVGQKEKSGITIRPYELLKLAFLCFGGRARYS